MDDLTALIRQHKEKGNWPELENLFELVNGSGHQQAIRALTEAFEHEVESCIVDATADSEAPVNLYRMAIRLADKILQLKPGDVATIGRQAFCQASLAEIVDAPEEAAGLAATALAQYDEAIRLGPRDGSILASKAGALISLGKHNGTADVVLKYFAEAFPLYLKAIDAAEPSWHFYTWREAIDYLERHEDPRVCAYAETARGIYKEAFGLVQHNPDALSEWAECLTQMGSLHQAHDDEEGARRLFDEALEILCELETLPPATPRVHMRAGRNFEAIALNCSTTTGELIRKAIKQYRLTIQLDPEDGYAYFYTAQAYEQLGRVENDSAFFENATQVYEDALTAEAEDHGLMLSYGRHLYKLSRITDSPRKEELMRQSADKYIHALFLGLENNMRPYHMLARIWHELGDDERAQAIFRYGLDGFWRCFDFRSVKQMDRFAELRKDPEIVALLTGYGDRDNLKYSDTERHCLAAAQLVTEANRKLNAGLNGLPQLREALTLYDQYGDTFFEHMRHGAALVDFAGFTKGEERHKALKRAVAVYTSAINCEPDLFPNPYAELVYIHQLMGCDDEADAWIEKMKEKFGTCYGLDRL